MIDLLSDSVSDLLVIEKLSKSNLNDSFSVLEKYSEYKDFLYNDAIQYQELYINNTYLLIERSSRKILAYISFACDTVALNPKEKKKASLKDVPYTFLPAFKITKLAVSNLAGDYNHIGSYLIMFACDKAFNCNTEFGACRIVSVDADVEHNPDVIKFYEKNGFRPLKSSIYKRKFPTRTKIIGMWKDMFE